MRAMNATAPLSTTASAPRAVAVLYGIFFLSGFCGLIYESIWSHYLKLLLGHASYAQAVVLVVFVGGLAIGAWLTGRFSERLRHPVLLYAIVEAIVGVIAFLFQRIFEAASAWATTSFLPAYCGEPGACSASWLLAAALILPPSILLGTTFPLMSVGVMRMGVQPGRGLSLLYFLNSAGAALGVLGSGFLLIPTFGLPGTMLLAGSMNALVALAAFAAWSHSPKAPPMAVPAAAAAAAQQTPTQLRLLLLVACLTGLSSFIYEVVWIRMLTLVFGAATHSFELMLAPFILGLAFGAWWVRNRIESATQPLRLLGTIQVVMGVAAVATLPLYVSLYDAMAFLLRTLTRTEGSYTVFNLVLGLMAAAVMLPATFCAGMTLPLITAILLRRGDGERQVGQVYGINTFGAIAGVLLTVHVLIPSLGLKWSLAFGAAIDVVLGFALWRLAGRDASAPALSAGWRAGYATAGVAAAGLLVALPMAAPLGIDRMASGVFRTGKARFGADDFKVVFHRDGKTASITVLESQDGVRSLLTNGKPDGATHPQNRTPTPDDQTMVMLGALGPLHHPNARRAAVIGLGTGTSTSVLLESRALEAVDTIEIEPMMVEAARHFLPRTAAAFNDPRGRIIIDDARAHFSKAPGRYDLILSEPSNPWVSGVASLFTREFYEHIQRHLADDGVFLQWLHLYEASPQVVGSIVRALSTVFPEFTVYATNTLDVVIVARADRKPATISPEAFERQAGLRQRLREIGIDNLGMLSQHSAGPGSAIRMLADSYGAPPNSDYFPYVDNRAGRDRFQNVTARALFGLPDAPLPFLEFARGASPHAGATRQAGGFMPDAVRIAAAGSVVLRYLQGETLTPAQQAGLGGLAVELALVRGWRQTCTLPNGTGLGWNAMIRTAAILPQGVKPADLTRFWEEFGARCRKNATPDQAAWLDLLTAVARRDAGAAREQGLRVLSLDRQLTPESREYATLATVSALIAMNERDQAASILGEQRRFLSAEQMEQPWMRYLVLVLSARAQNRPPAG